MLAILILAAGASRRMGGADKLLEPVNGGTLLSRTVKAACATGHGVWVTLPSSNAQRLASLQTLEAHPVLLTEPDKGMGHSLASGVVALPPDISGVMILPADMPGVSTEDLLQVSEAWAARPDSICRARDETGPGHPVVFPRRCFEQLMDLRGDQGARDVIAADTQPVLEVTLPGDHATLDLDTPEDWQRWRARQTSDQRDT